MAEETDISVPALRGLLAEFPSAESLLHAAARVRDEGYARWDAFTPYPVHGMDRAMGLQPTRLPWLVLLCGLAGGAVGMLLQWWTNAVDYPYLISGKPLFSLPSNIPVVFELTVLFSAFGAFFGMLIFNDLPRFWHPVFTNPRFRRVTTDGFFLAVEADDPRFDVFRTKDLLSSLQATHVEELRC